MAYLSIIKMYKGNYDCLGSCLRMPATEVTSNEFGSEWLEKFILDMFETLYSHSSGVGLAANQVGVLKKICVIDIKKDGKKPMVLINPQYVPVANEMVESQEVCLSFPMVSSIVRRYKKINVIYQDFYGKEYSIVAEGFKANVFQHEIDHLNGIVHIDLLESEEDISDYEGYSAKVARCALNSILEE